MDCDRSSGRSRIGTQIKEMVGVLEAKLRSFFGAIEDWNPILRFIDIRIKLRSFFGAIEDWNDSGIV